jgi:hypothetical protein
MKDVVVCDKLRGADKQALIRRFPNGETHRIRAVSIPEYIGYEKRTRGTETSKYPEEKKSTEIPLVAASERGTAELIICSGRIWEGPRNRVIAPYTKWIVGRIK